MRFASIGSGSEGNGLVVEAGGTRILIDCGFGVRDTAKRLARIGVAPDSLSAIIVTHEHSDHIRALDPIVRRGIPIYCSKGTAIGAGLEPRSYSQLSFNTSFQIDALKGGEAASRLRELIREHAPA